MEERMRREKMHAQLLGMDMCPVLSKEAALEIGVGSLNLAIDFCLNEQTRERVRKEAQKVVQKTGLRSQGAQAASLRGTVRSHTSHTLFPIQPLPGLRAYH